MPNCTKRYSRRQREKSTSRNYFAAELVYDAHPKNYFYRLRLIMDIAAVRALVATDLTATDNLIDTCLQSEIDLIQQLGRHLIHSGGKRLRPLVVLLSAHAFNYRGDKHITLAAIIELIHTVTLLHDDVVDASELRRGQKTANAVWGNAASVLVGDFLYSRTFQMMASIGSLPIMQLLADATNVISKGEILQLLNCKDPTTSEARYMEVIRAKTGALFATAAQMGPVLSQCSESEITAASNYGMQLGIAFQLIDDALDYSAATETLGKNRGDDLAEGKPTLPLIYALQHSTPEQANCIRNAIQQASCADLDAILQTIESTQAIAYTCRLAKQHVAQAIQNLRGIPDTPYRTALIALAEFAVERSY
jgi:octaprenyl-diphosphate synthase